VTDILSYFTGTPRPQQEEALLSLEKCWNDYDVFALDMPVATGKSLVAATIARWIRNSVIITPTNILLHQYEKDFPEFSYLRRKDMYPCEREYKDCAKNLKICRECKYKAAKKTVMESNINVMNYYMYLALRKNNKYSRRTVIIDEMQGLIPMLEDLAAHRIWKHKFNYPTDLHTEEDILSWLEESGLSETKKFQPIIKSLHSTEPNYRFERTTEYNYGIEKELIKARPVSVKNYKPILWPYQVHKIILMSATVSPTDIRELGLNRKRVKYIKTGSPIPPSSRPVIYCPIASFSHSNLSKATTIAAEFLKKLLAKFKAKGIIHCTYALANKLRMYLDNPRLIWHDKENKRSKYTEFLERTDNCVFVACGLSEGIDITNELGRWQVILKVPFPSLADTAVNLKARDAPDWYSWCAVKSILQASGRICRHPGDFGLTIIADEAFAPLYRRNRELWPDWFCESLVGG